MKFITSYATEYDLPMPAAPHERDNHPPIYLPASDTKLVVFKKKRLVTTTLLYVYQQV